MDYESMCRGFKSLRARHYLDALTFLSSLPTLFGEQILSGIWIFLFI